jgi:hypothetical protein
MAAMRRRSAPTLANAAAATINIVQGFPTDSAKATGGDFTPFAVFFANATTMYVTDEGSGNATDAASQRGLSFGSSSSMAAPDHSESIQPIVLGIGVGWRRYNHHWHSHNRAASHV